MSFITLHIVNALPLHNMNRDQNGLPKSAMDGGVQRARLSSQSLKRAARVAYQSAHQDEGSIRTRVAWDEIVRRAGALAEAQGIELDRKKANATAKAVIKKFSHKDDDKVDQGDKDGEPDSGKDTILLWGSGELDTIAQRIVDGETDPAAIADAAVGDCVSSSLDVAAFGRMFAGAPSKGTHAAVAVGHATTTHQMALTMDYFTAVEELVQDHSGAAHIDMAYFTSGVYYRSITIDPAQLRRSWSGIGADSASDQLRDLVHALVTALPKGRATNSAPNTLPVLVLAEEQKTRTCYGFDTPVRPDRDGGYIAPTLEALAAQRQAAVRFDRANFPDAWYVQTTGHLTEDDLAGATDTETLDGLVQRVVDAVLRGAR